MPCTNEIIVILISLLFENALTYKRMLGSEAENRQPHSYITLKYYQIQWCQNTLQFTKYQIYIRPYFSLYVCKKHQWQKTNQVERWRAVSGRVRQRTVVVLLHGRPSSTSHRSKRTVYGRVHRRQVGHERHVRRVQQLQLWLVVQEPRHPVDQSLPQKRCFSTAAVCREQSHDATSLDEYVEHCLHLLQDGLGTDLHHSHHNLVTSTTIVTNRFAQYKGS